MTREIKFRGRRVGKKEWVYGYLCYSVMGYLQIQVVTRGVLNSFHYDTFEVVPESIGQFTGLKDKNGVDIYAGDIISGHKKEQGRKYDEGWQIKERVYEMYGGFELFGKPIQEGYRRDDNVLYQFMWRQSGSHTGSDTYWQIDNIEVIGNVYENPELLEP